MRYTVVAQWFNCEERYIKITIHYTLRKTATLKYCKRTKLEICGG